MTETPIQRNFIAGALGFIAMFAGALGFIAMFRKNIKRFIDDQSGAVIALVIVLFLTMVVASGMAVDFMRQEAARADLQNALDRGVLAAASLDQGLPDKKAVVADYMKSRSFRIAELDLDVTATDGGNYLRIDAKAGYILPTYFLKLIGIMEFDLRVASSAEERRGDVEISLVLDVSGSMDSSTSVPKGSPSQTRLQRLKTSGLEFIDAILGDGTTAQVAGDKTFISIIPYSAQTNAGLPLANAFNLLTHHTYSYCFDFSFSDYSRTDIPATPRPRQFQHFKRTSAINGCPKSNNQITPYSNNRTALRTAIQNLGLEGNTAVYVGVKWGATLLDPATAPVVDKLITAGVVAKNFEDSPVGFSSLAALKIMVVMTDGENTNLDMIVEPRYTDKGVAYWAANMPGTYKLNGNTYNEMIQKISNSRSIGGVKEGDYYLDKICTAAKAQGIRIYTIGFDLTTSSANALSKCASAPSTHYLVTGVNISNAFGAIAQDILKLRLIN